jgi:hypothetical protein
MRRQYRHAVALLVEALCYSRKVAGSIPDEIIEFSFNLPNPSSHSMAVAFTQTNGNEY